MKMLSRNGPAFESSGAFLRLRPAVFSIVGGAENQNGGFAVPFHEKAIVVLDGAIHDLAELRPGGEGGNLAGHND